MVWTGLIVGHRGPYPGEVGLLEAMNDLPRTVGAPLEVVMQLGILGLGLVVVAVVAVATAPRGIAPTATVLLALLVAYWLQIAMKPLVERPRPRFVVDSLTVREVAGGFAFPSGHATIAFALASSISLLLTGRWRWVPFGVAALTAVARLYVGVHWPTDLIGGAALGTAVGAGSWLVVDGVVRRRRPEPA